MDCTALLQRSPLAPLFKPKSVSEFKNPNMTNFKSEDKILWKGNNGRCISFANDGLHILATFAGPNFGSKNGF